MLKVKTKHNMNQRNPPKQNGKCLTIFFKKNVENKIKAQHELKKSY
jgi:hypothetical protein